MRIHIVSPTDTLAALSVRYCIPGCMILRANLHIAGGLFKPGLKLYIPEPNFCAKLARQAAKLQTILEIPEHDENYNNKQNQTEVYTHVQYILQEGDSIYRLAQKYKTSAAQILLCNDACLPEDLVIGQSIRLPIPRPGYRVYTVKASDTLQQIARHHRMSTDRLHELNDLSIGMYPGMQLVVIEP